MLFVIDPVDLVFMSTAKRNGASRKLITWRIDISYLNRILLVRDIHELDGIAVPRAIVTIDGIDNLSLLLYGAAVGDKDHGSCPITQFIPGEHGLYLCLILGEWCQAFDEL